MSNYTKQAAEVTYHHFDIMAGCSKQFDFVFDGGLQSQTRASLVNEVVKHLLYERNQIPLQFDILKQQMMVNEAKSLQVRCHSFCFLAFISLTNSRNFLPVTLKSAL